MKCHDFMKCRHGEYSHGHGEVLTATIPIINMNHRHGDFPNDRHGDSRTWRMAAQCVPVLRDGVLLALVHFSKHSGRQGFIKHLAQLLFSGAHHQRGLSRSVWPRHPLGQYDPLRAREPGKLPLRTRTAHSIRACELTNSPLPCERVLPSKDCRFSASSAQSSSRSRQCARSKHCRWPPLRRSHEGNSPCDERIRHRFARYMGVRQVICGLRLRR
ncbi:hypothetical protein T492DRAFT_267642 [Pavlovales sp. CCMP2436]|nr:hypothetical protein T492DRAFT_267642 [Pavlovales sp. CCMP2436]